MNIALRALAAIVLLAGALLGGLVLLLGLRDQVNLDWSTYGLYWQALDQPQVAYYALRIEIAGIAGLGLPLLIWPGLLAWLLFKCPAWSLYEVVPHQPAPVQPQPRTAAASATPNPTEIENMNFRQMIGATTLGVPAASAPVLSGCGQKDYTNVRFRHNPHPVERYELTVKVDNAPGPFKVASASTNFQIFNLPNNPSQVPAAMCVPPEQPNGTPVPILTGDGATIPLTQTSPTTWTGLFNLDEMLDGNYFDHGVCSWEFEGVEVYLGASGAKGEMSFYATMGGKNVRHHLPSVMYFSRKVYPGLNSNSYLNIGVTDRRSYDSTVTDADLFTITLSARKVTP
jgi:hypothetical protein